jgi:hypothetical protein
MVGERIVLTHLKCSVYKTNQEGKVHVTSR